MTVKQKKTPPGSNFFFFYSLIKLILVVYTHTNIKTLTSYFKTYVYTRNSFLERNAVNTRAGTRFIFRSTLSTHSKYKTKNIYLYISRVRPRKPGESPSQWKAHTAPECNEPLSRLTEVYRSDCRLDPKRAAVPLRPTPQVLAPPTTSIKRPIRATSAQASGHKSQPRALLSSTLYYAL